MLLCHTLFSHSVSRFVSTDSNFVSDYVSQLVSRCVSELPPTLFRALSPFWLPTCLRVFLPSTMPLCIPFCPLVGLSLVFKFCLLLWMPLLSLPHVSGFVPRFVSQLVRHFIPHLVSHHVTDFVSHFVSRFASSFFPSCSAALSLTLSQSFSPTASPTLSVILPPRRGLKCGPNIDGTREPVHLQFGTLTAVGLQNQTGIVCSFPTQNVCTEIVCLKALRIILSSCHCNGNNTVLQGNLFQSVDARMKPIDLKASFLSIQTGKRNIIFFAQNIGVV